MWCLIGERSHVSGVKKSGREWLCKLACKQLFPFAFTAPSGAPQSDTATTSPNNEKRSFSPRGLRVVFWYFLSIQKVHNNEEKRQFSLGLCFDL
jgi:hypothetical protein